MSYEKAAANFVPFARQSSGTTGISDGQFYQPIICQLMSAGESLLLAAIAFIILSSHAMPKTSSAFAFTAAATVGTITFLIALLSGASSYDRFASRAALFPGAMAAALCGAISGYFGGAGSIYILLLSCALFCGVYITKIPLVLLKQALDRSDCLTRKVAILSADSERIDACAALLAHRKDVRVVFTGTPNNLASLEELVRLNQLGEIVLADPESPDNLAALASLSVVLVHMMPSDAIIGSAPAGQGVTRFSGPWNCPVAILSRLPLCGWNAVIKRAMDIAGSLIALLLLSPLMIACAILIRLDSPGPAVFVQVRAGYRNSRFRMFKFRSMQTDCTDASGWNLTKRQDPRVTRMGAFIRRTSIDELPQLFNVLLGNMSLVGPRPHPLAAKAGAVLYDELIPNFYSRYRMKPGITGLAQVCGLRGNTETEQSLIDRFQKDMEYADGWTPILDVIILCRTIAHLMKSKNAF